MIGKRIAQMREKKGMSQKQLADMLGIAQSMVAQWERGTKTISSQFLEPLSEILEVGIEWLVIGDTESA